MSNLSQDLEMLRKLNENRRVAKELREQALRPLKRVQLNKNRTRAKELREQALHALKRIELNEGGLSVDVVRRQLLQALERIEREDKLFDETESPFEDGDKEGFEIDFGRWVAADDEVEIALLVKVQNHRELGEKENENNKQREASDTLKGVLERLNLKKLLQPPSEGDNRSTMPVLLAARAMQALVNRAKTVFEPATMYCYYRIIRELYGVAQPNWTVGAARAGIGGTTSAFVTNECIRAIFAFENALERTSKFFEETLTFYQYFSALKQIIEEWHIQPNTPLYKWANKSLEARWLDCQIATNPRNREMALFYSEKPDGENALLLPDKPHENDLCIKNTEEYFKSLRAKLIKAVDDLFHNVAEVYERIYRYRGDEKPKIVHPLAGLESTKDLLEYEFNPEREKIIKGATTREERREERAREAKIAKYNRSATAHLFAERTIRNAVDNARILRGILAKDEGRDRIEEILEGMAKKFYTIRRRVHHVLEPSKQYLKWVLGRELAAPKETFDAGELVFAATSYGAINNWRLDDKLKRACELLIKSLPDNGRLPTKRPFHAEPRGYRTIPIGCEMTRALATLLQKTGYDFDAEFVGRMLGIFEENFSELHESTADNKLIGWNFDGAPDPGKPAVWVTAVSVLALDRIVRMLNTRINEIVLAHFDVTQPERPHTELTLQDLIYSDYALVLYGPLRKPVEHEEELTAILLQKARAHVMRATLPDRYGQDNKDFSTIYYGPPGTGKTTLAESLAFSAGVPLLRLSPGDLILQGQELIEGRAHDVFEALSMLTQCVLIFDEFEPVLENRGKGAGSSPNELTESAVITDVLQHISGNDPKFRFVLGGMLPKLIKLHDAAEKQSFAYCLGTNRLNDIDRAAKRNGRFDKRVPVYKPDALSRAGALLFCLGQAKKLNVPDKKTERVSELQRFMRILCKTIGQPADRISRLFKIEKDEKGLMGTLGYILNDRELPKELKKESQKQHDDLKQELATNVHLDKDEKEKEQRIWIRDYENGFLPWENNIGQTENEIMERLNRCLAGESKKEERPQNNTPSSSA